MWNSFDISGAAGNSDVLLNVITNVIQLTVNRMQHFLHNGRSYNVSCWRRFGAVVVVGGGASFSVGGSAVGEGPGGVSFIDESSIPSGSLSFVNVGLCSSCSIMLLLLLSSIMSVFESMVGLRWS